MSHHVYLLSTRQRSDLLHHFLQLAPDDRQLRFGTQIADAGIETYVDSIDFVDSDVFAVHDDSLHINGAIHIAYKGDEAEMGLSVLQDVRGQGIGNSLFERATVHLSNRFVRSATMHCLRENGAVMHLARKNGMRIVVDGAEADAWLELPQATPETIAAEWVAGRFALLDYNQKVRAGYAYRLLQAFEG